MHLTASSLLQSCFGSKKRRLIRWLKDGWAELAPEAMQSACANILYVIREIRKDTTF